MNPERQLAEVSMELVLREPFFGHLLVGLPRRFSEEVGGVCLEVGEGGVLQLTLSPAFWERLERPAWRRGWLKHQLLHLVLGHFEGLDRVRQPLLFHIAADLVVNELLGSEERPDFALTREHFPEFDLPDSAAAEELYARLQREWERLQQQDGPANASQALLAACLLEAHPELTEHEPYLRALRRMFPSERLVLSGELERRLRSALEALTRGEDLPPGLSERLPPGRVRAPGLDWRRVLRSFSQRGRSTRLRNTIRRPSKRYGTVPGIRIERRHRLLLAVDVSGSVSEPLLARFFEEIHHLWKRGAEITVAEFDTRIRRRYPYAGSPPRRVSGRGGTLYEAPLQLADELLPDGLIVLTDGHGPRPQTRTLRPLLWVLAAESGAPPALAGFPGRVSLLEPRAQRRDGS